jgi:hypothetical protein
MVIRQNRQLERELHKDANDYYKAHHNGKGENARVLDRTTIMNIKKMLVTEQPKYFALR